MLPILLKTAAGLASSVLLLWVCKKLERAFLQKRDVAPLPDTIVFRVVVGVVFAALCTFTVLRETPPRAAYLILLLFLAMMATVMDLKYRIIPNDLVLMLLAVQAAALALGLADLRLKSCLLGLLAAGALFLAPSFFKKQVGGGDIKLASAVGFCVGFTDTLYVIALMGTMILAYSYLKTLNLRLALQKYVPMGPFICTAFIIILMQSI